MTSILTILPGNQNLAAYREAGLNARHISIPLRPSATDAVTVFEALHEALEDPTARVLVHGETIDDDLAGFLAGYLVWSGIVNQPIMAVALVEEILRRPLGPEARALVPS